MSEVVGTLGEQISCIERVLEINPNNQTAKLALQKLKSQPSRTGPLPQPASNGLSNAAYASTPQNSAAAVSAAPVAAGDPNRKPFRLNKLGDQGAPQAPAVHHQATMALPPMPMPDDPAQAQNLPQQPKSPGQSLLKSNGARPVFEPAKATGEPEEFPLLPIILFGALSVTALGGLAMIVLLIFFS